MTNQAVYDVAWSEVHWQLLVMLLFPFMQDLHRSERIDGDTRGGDLWEAMINQYKGVAPSTLQVVYIYLH